MTNHTTPENYTLFQGFEWNCPTDGKHWDRLREELPDLVKIGISNIWLPPGCKGDSPTVCQLVQDVRYVIINAIVGCWLRDI